MSTDPRNENDSGDEQLASEWLAAIDNEVAPVRQDVVDRVTQLAGDLFLNDSSPLTPTNSVAQPSTNRRQNHMFTKLLVSLSAIAATIILFFNLTDPASGDLTLASVLDKTVDAKSLQLTIVKEGTKADVLVWMPGKVRWTESPTKYRIASGSLLWQIDEQANTVESEDNPWIDKAEGRVDLLSMLGLEEKQTSRFRESVAVGKKARIFRLVTTGEPPLFIEAVAGLESGLLETIAAWPANKRTGPPLAELTLVARDVRVDETQFVVAKSLSEDGRIGKVIDSQGIVTLRPMMGRRWTPVARQMLLKPGDWLRTDVRGANASAIILTSRFKIIAGPGSLIELHGPHHLKLHGGEVKIAGGKKATGVVELIGPGDKALEVAAGSSAHYRLDRDQQIQKVTKKPKWLAGFEGSSSDESIGSLVANIDGRDTPLTVGFHKVKVEIRDQIARTTIEQSFVNHTPRRLEGIFHFPLPQDASISGFGMWINGELIEADVVEKQRAREIYETILREKRDPGLLEWTGGNIFKARVFPIEGHAEKRIRIVYTQVLPLRTNQYRYSYGLQSELLQTTPVRELSLEVQVHSALPLKAVTCPTHTVRSQLTAHSAKLEFTAQEYTPERDFEVVCEVDSKQSDVVVVPHRRAEDGYFLVQLTPPGREGNWQRDVLPDGEPLKLLLVCDTSASMSSTKREQQQQFVASLLASLGPKDRFNIAVSDVNCRWRADALMAPSADSTADALEWLGGRLSLGWTDLDRMTESVLNRSGNDAHVIYIGDGIVTARDADPQTFVNRMKRLTADKQSTFHAVSVGNSFESTVLRAIAHIGGGSVRQISGEQTPQRVAFELLNEIAQPALNDLRVEFRGLQVAATYPDQLPNLSAGTQQILIGRYLPQGEDQTGEIIITGERDGETVRFTSRIALADAEAGNSFIPRLWARAHLDHLLQQGSSASTKDEIIAMSEEFHIITPYTSLLVLETDGDRERFGVKRRYQMRDGERFFADGRDNATYELLQQQMKRAGDWRLGLRRRILSQLTRLGRDSQLFQQAAQNFGRWGGMAGSGPMGSAMPASGPVDAFSGVLGGGGFGGGGFAGEMLEGRSDLNGVAGYDFSGDEQVLLDDEDAAPELDEVDGMLHAQDFRKLKRQSADKSEAAALPALFQRNRQSLLPSVHDVSRGLRSASQAVSVGGRVSGFYSGQPQNHYVQWINALFPQVSTPPVTPQPVETKWQAEALTISKSLQQPIALDGNGIAIQQHTQSTDPRWSRTTSIRDLTTLYSDQRWLSFSQAAGAQTLVQWCDQEQRSIYSRAFRLGRTRKATPRDLKSFVPGQRAYAVSALHDSYRDYDAQIERPADDRIVLRLTHPTQKQLQIVITIDAERSVVTETQQRRDDEVTSSTKYSDYTEAAGVWWPGRIETFDGKGRSTSVTTQTAKVFDDDAFAVRFAAELPAADESQLLSMPMPSVRESEIAVAAGSASFEHRLMLLVRSSMIQKWDEVLRQLDALEQLSPEKPGLAWIRAAVLLSARKNEDARQLLQEQADRIVAGGLTDELFLSGYVVDQASQVVDHNELLRLLDRLRPVFDRQREVAAGPRSWAYRRTQSLRSLGRVDEYLEGQHNLAASAPWDLAAQTIYAHDLANNSDHGRAYAWLRQELDRDVERHEHEIWQLRNTYAQLLRNAGRSDEYATFLTEWIATEPTNEQVYQQYLSALDLANRSEDTEAAARKWLAEGRVDGKLEAPALARLNAAVNYALGQRYQQYMNWIDPLWLPPMQETGRFFLEHEHHFDVAQRIIGHYRFTQSDESDRLLAEVARRLEASAETLAETYIASYVGWAVGRGDVNKEGWQRIANTLRQRWEAAEDLSKRRTLGAALLQIYATHSRDEQHLPFLRTRIARAEDDDKPAHVAAHRLALFNELLSRPWSDKYEAEALSLIERLAADQPVSLRLIEQVKALHRFVDRMLESRFQADMRKLQDEEHPEELKRTEWAAKKTEFRKTANESVADRLSEKLERQPDAPRAPEDAAGLDELLHWVRLERVYLDVRLGRKLNRAAKECWTMLGDTPVVEEDLAGDVLDEEQAEAAGRAMIEAARRERAYATVNYLAVRRSAPQSLVDRVMKYVDAGVKLEGDAAAPWKLARYQLLVALDLPDELQRDLHEWIRSDLFPAPWQLVLGRLLAERGKIEEAIGLFETVERNSQLAPSDYQALGDWYLVVDRRDQYHKAKVEVFKATEEYRLNNWLWQQRQPWYRSDVPLPTELDKDVLFAFQALFEKSDQPQNYVYQLRDFYTACRDFRLLKMLPDAITGRTPQQIYPFLKSLQSNLLYELRNEATADEILKRVAEVRTASESAVDLRALDLFEAMIERQSAEVLNEPGPHIDASLDALQRAFQREWADGEVRQMADLLDSLGTIKQGKLNEERLRQLRELQKLTEVGTADRLFVTWHLSHALFWSHDERDEGLATMEIGVRQFEQSHTEGLPAHANTPLTGYISMLEAAAQFTNGEQQLTKHLAKPLTESQQYWLMQRRNQLYHEALRKGGQVSLGSGDELYENLEAHLLEQLAASNTDSHREQAINELLAVYRTAKGKKIDAVGEDLREFAFMHLPPLLIRQTNNYQNIVSNVANLVRQQLGPREALAFAIERYEAYPKRFAFTYQSAWRQLADRMDLWHYEIDRKFGDLEPRLLAIVLDELRRDMRSRNSHTRYFYTKVRHDRPMWIEKKEDFARVAEEVLKERSESGRAAVYVAQYLFHGLQRQKRAVEILLIAHDKKNLDVGQQIALVHLLHHMGRFGEAVPILQPIAAAHPDSIQYRTLLVKAYRRSGRQQQMRELLADTDAHFRQGGRWTESNIAHLAAVCLEEELYAKASGYYGEVIPLHQRTAPNRGIGGYTLSGYYTSQARAFSGQGKTREAVDAAAAGVIAWGANQSNRQNALHWLGRVIAEAKDLDDYVKYLDKQAAGTGQDSPLIRQYVGLAFAQRNQHLKAVKQFQISIKLQPTDVETRNRLIESYEKLKDREGLVQQTLALLDIDRHNLEAYKKLANYLRDDEALAERAATTIVEAAPSEAEHHQALAELRQQQDRWPDAIDHWKHVARLRALEPTGLLKLAAGQVHEKRFDQAQESIDHLNRTEWPSRFGDVRSQARTLQQQIPETR